MREKFEDQLIRLYEKYPKTKVIVKVYYYLISQPFDYIKSSFEKEVKLHINTISSSTAKKTFPYSIGGVVISGRNAYSFNEVPYEEIDNLINTFKEEDKPIDFEIEYRGGWHQTIRLSPKLREIMAIRLEELRDEHGTETLPED